MIQVVILAAGKGSRMKSKLPKVLHTVAGKPMVTHVVDNVKTLAPESIFTVVGHGADRVKSELGERVHYRSQDRQLGTGHAVAQCAADLNDESIALILYADVPLLSSETMERVCEIAQRNGFAVLGQKMSNPSGYGRLIRDQQGNITEIVEHKDATAEQRLVDEVNTGIMAVQGSYLKKWLAQLSNHNAQNEYYLTDIVAFAVADGVKVDCVFPQNDWEVLGANDRQQVARLERCYQQYQANSLMDKGVAVLDPARIDIRGSVNVGLDVEIDVNVVFEGDVTLGDNVYIGPNSVIKHSYIGDNTRIESHSVIDSVKIGDGASVGPFARLRPGTIVSDNCKIGNFVETKNTTLSSGSKVNHLSYIGDASVGCNANIGAGVITCNYDGANKHKTVIGDNAFIGSNNSLVAPVEIGNNATTAAGSTITRSVPDDELSVARAPQKTLSGWVRPRKVKQ